MEFSADSSFLAKHLHIALEEMETKVALCREATGTFTVEVVLRVFNKHFMLIDVLSDTIEYELQRKLI